MNGMLLFYCDRGHGQLIMNIKELTYADNRDDLPKGIMHL